MLELGKEGLADLEARGAGWMLKIDIVEAAGDGNLDDIERWIGGGGGLNVTNSNGNTPLIKAAL